MDDLSILKLPTHHDARGIFSRTYDIASQIFPVAQANISSNPIKSTLRGMHYQVAGPREDKLITLISGAVYMALIDLRKNSRNYLKVTEINIAEPLSEAIYVPSGYATGWISTSENTVLQYLMSARYEECTYSGIKYNDEHFKISWPTLPVTISEQDLKWPEFSISE
jgi:dTDP-4-dehydrorhamnose 3,5-epimerase